jgi:hypothetical protein
MAVVKSCAFLWTALIAAQATAVDVRQILHAKYQELNRAIVRNDAKGMERWVLANCEVGFVYVSKGKGKYDRKQFIQGLKDQMRFTKKVDRSTQRIAARGLSGKQAIVSLASDFKGNSRSMARA